MKRNAFALALVAGMATMAFGPAMAQSQSHGQHGQHMQHGLETGDAEQTGPATQAAPPAMPGYPMMQGKMMRGPMMHGKASMHQMHGDTSGNGHVDGEAASHVDIDMSASSIAYRAVNEAMHHGMNIEMTGNADVDFVRGMLAHHAGAVDMARIVQIFGSDPQIAALAGEIIAAQEAEIAVMRDWLDRNAPGGDE